MVWCFVAFYLVFLWHFTWCFCGISLGVFVVNEINHCIIVLFCNAQKNACLLNR